MNKIICGECIEVMNKLPKINVILTFPPYNTTRICKTQRACKELGYEFIGIEKEKEYVDICVKRLEV